MAGHEEPDEIDVLSKLSLDELLERLSADPDHAFVLQQIGIRYYEQQEFAEAESYYRRAIAADPDDGWNHLYLGNLHYAFRRSKEALAEFHRGVELLPDVACPIWCIGDVFRSLGDHAEAGKYYKRAARLDPGDRRAQRRLSEWYEREYADWR